MANHADYLASAIEMMVLKMLSEEKMYGYQIIKLVNERTDGEFKWKEGSLYPVLHKLASCGQLQCEWVEVPGYNRPRRYYSITPAGLESLQTRLKDWKSYTANVNAVMLLQGGVI